MSKDKKIYSIIDIETTGGRKTGHKITEIAIINFDGEKILEEFSTLINPERNIPEAITFVTGISNEMVSGAPKFYEVAKKIVEMTKGNVFVAHNVFFDYNFIKHEFQELGYSYNREKICTVRLARKKLPGHKSYSLGKICNDLGISITNRHRALGDAKATVELLKLILEKDENSLRSYVESEGKKISLPTRLERSEYEMLPNLPGVYYFYDEEGKLLYVGKSKDIKKRVSSHFRPDMKRAKDIKLKNLIAKIDYRVLGNELAALLYEAHEIKELRPEFNVSLKRRFFPIAVDLYLNKEGELELRARKRNLEEEHPYIFPNKKKAMAMINAIYKAVLGLEKDSLNFESSKRKLISIVGRETYNNMLTKSLQRKDDDIKDYLLKLQGRVKGEICLIDVENNYPVHINFFSEQKSREEGEIFPLIKDQDLKNILQKYLTFAPSLQKHKVTN